MDHSPNFGKPSNFGHAAENGPSEGEKIGKILPVFSSSSLWSTMDRINFRDEVKSLKKTMINLKKKIYLANTLVREKKKKNEHMQKCLKKCA